MIKNPKKKTKYQYAAKNKAVDPNKKGFHQKVMKTQ